MRYLVRKFLGERLEHFKTVSNISDKRVSQLRAHLPNNRRQQTKIAVIDDKPFEPSPLLRNHSYNITEIGDIRKASDVKDFQIVLCDLMGVGSLLDRHDEGAGIIREIRRNFPSIIVAAYTGASASHEPVKKAKQLADEFIKKDETIDVWTEKLDRLIEMAMDPRIVWYRVRGELVRQRVDTVELLRLEDAFVRSIEQRDREFKHLQGLAAPEKIGANASDIVKGLISNTIFHLFLSQ